tara:strand:+ start:73 stop:501 length:429 start_codon:yes stop_codon:yes gene_type:complete
MKQFFLILKVLFVYFMLVTAVLAKESDYFKKGKELFQNNELDKSKIFFERDIVFNPKSEKSYLYLAKIFKNNENDLEEEINLNSVLLLNPKNDEAIYMLTLLKIKQSNYEEAKELIDKFILVCKSFCSKENEIKNKFKKLTP